MKPTYEIAKYIPMKIRRQMVAAEYKKRRSSGFRECADGKCPMGWLANIKVSTPTPRTIAENLQKLGLARAKKLETYDLAVIARTFTDDWDDGKIKDLHKALGVPKK